MNDGSVTIRRLNASVRLSGDIRSLDWVKERGQLYFEFLAQAEPDRTWKIVAGAENAPDIPWELYTRGSVGEKVCYWFNREKQTVVVDSVPGPWRNLWTLRLVRHLLRWQLFHAGAVFVHGGLFERHGKGCALVGPSRAGKTTLLVRLMEISGNSLIGEDDLTLVQDADGSVRALGWPGCIRVRRDALNMLPGISDLSKFSHPANELDSTLDPRIGRLRIFHEELAKATGCKILPETRLASILEVGWGAMAAVMPIDRGQITEALMACWDILPERKPGTRPKPGHKDLPYWREFCFNPFLLDCFGLPSTIPQMKTPADCAAALCGYRVKHIGGSAPIERILEHLS